MGKRLRFASQRTGRSLRQVASRETRYSIRAARGYGPRDCHEFTRRGFCCTCRSPTAQARPGPPSPCQLWRDLFVSSVTGGRRVQTERHWLTYYDQRWSNQLKLRWSISIWRSTRLVRCRAGGIMTIQTDNRLHGCWPTRTRLWLNWWNPVSPPDGSGHTDELAPNSSWLPATYLRAPIKEPVLLVGSGGLHAGDSLLVASSPLWRICSIISRYRCVENLVASPTASKAASARTAAVTASMALPVALSCLLQKSPANVSARGSIEALSPSAGCARFDTDTGITSRCHARNDNAGGRSLPCLRPQQRHPPRPDTRVFNTGPVTSHAAPARPPLPLMSAGAKG